MCINNVKNKDVWLRPYFVVFAFVMTELIKKVGKTRTQTLDLYFFSSGRVLFSQVITNSRQRSQSQVIVIKCIVHADMSVDVTTWRDLAELVIQLQHLCCSSTHNHRTTSPSKANKFSASRYKTTTRVCTFTYVLRIENDDLTLTSVKFKHKDRKH